MIASFKSYGVFNPGDARYLKPQGSPCDPNYSTVAQAQAACRGWSDASGHDEGSGETCKDKLGLYLH